MTCQARQYSDHMVCSKCALAWDTNDQYPPDCRMLHHGALRRQKERQAAIRYAKIASGRISQENISIAIYAFCMGLVAGTISCALAFAYS